jgi:hypothetical protein
MALIELDGMLLELGVLIGSVPAKISMNPLRKSPMKSFSPVVSFMKKSSRAPMKAMICARPAEGMVVSVSKLAGCQRT